MNDYQKLFDPNYLENELGEKIAIEIRKKYIDFNFVGYDKKEKMFIFQMKKHKTYDLFKNNKLIRKGGVLHNKWVKDSFSIFAKIECYKDQLTNGDLDFLIENHLTQEPHERFNEFFESRPNYYNEDHKDFLKA